ncbi:response regulator [Eubacteriales bacterium OttesenSCG-928-A19]|nr:response regulator [Eubacteriales bacterium OttesenSCG-928-A19]
MAQLYTVYLVDDEPLALAHMAESFTWNAYGFEIIGQSLDPREAAEEICEKRPDVVFTDLRMPGMTGIEMIEMIRARHVSPCFVIVSAHRDFDSIHRLLRVHGFDYLIKPVTTSGFEDLFMRLHAALSARDPEAETVRESPSEDLNRILAYLQVNYTQKLNLQQISEQFAIHQNAVCNLFAKHMGTTFVRYLISLRMDKAARMLRQTTKSIKEIAITCGYDDYFYFCRIFRQYFQCTPTSYRRDA